MLWLLITVFDLRELFIIQLKNEECNILRIITNALPSVFNLKAASFNLSARICWNSNSRPRWLEFPLLYCLISNSFHSPDLSQYPWYFRLNLFISINSWAKKASNSYSWLISTFRIVWRAPSSSTTRIPALIFWEIHREWAGCI